MFREAFFSTLLCVALVPLHAQIDGDPGDVSSTPCTGINQKIWICLSCLGSNFTKSNGHTQLQSLLTRN